MSAEDVASPNPVSPDTFKNTREENRSINSAKTVQEAKSQLAQLQQRHTSITADLDKSISSHEDLSRQLRRLDLPRARLGSLAVTARTISHDVLSGAALTAGKIAGAVDKLDLEQARVKATLEVVEQVAQLKSCILGVIGSMGAPQDWENAAEYIHRASQIPASVIDSGFAEQVVPTAEVPDSPRVTLDSSAQSLCQLFLREFENAVEEGDGAKITRFFKMFPLIGRSKEGLDAYGKYVCQGVAIRARTRLQTGPGSGHKDGFFYSNALTKLFEHIAQVIDGHSPLVERHYGTGTMTKVMERLHREADVQGGIILDTWSDERTIDRKLTDVKSYAYSFLVQSFLPAQKTFGGTPRTQSPAPGATSNANQQQQDDSIDMREVDKVLSESGAMLAHWSLYLRFIASRTTPSSEDSTNVPTTPTIAGIEPREPQHTEVLIIPNFIKNSNLPRKVQKHLIEPFSTFGTFFLRRSVERAFQMDESPASGLSLNLSKAVPTNTPFITSAVDDVMYIVNQILQRSMSTSSAEIVVSASTFISRVLGSDFISMMQRKMRDECYPKPVVQGGIPPEDKVIAFCILINNLDVATDYIKRIISTARFNEPEDTDKSTQQRRRRSTRTQNEGATNGHTNAEEDEYQENKRSLDDLFPLHHDSTQVRTSLRNLETTFLTKANELVSDGLSVLFQQVTKPRLRPMLTETFRETDYSIEDERFYERLRHETTTQDPDNNNDDNFDDTSSTTKPEYNTPTPTEEPHRPLNTKTVKSRLTPLWTQITKPLTRLLTPKNRQKYLNTTTLSLSSLLERRIWSYYSRVSPPGALSLEKDILDVVNVVTKDENWENRKGFERVVSVVTVMNLEEEEWGEVLRAKEEEEEEGKGGRGDGVGVGASGSGGAGGVEEEWGLSWAEMERARGIVFGRD